MTVDELVAVLRVDLKSALVVAAEAIAQEIRDQWAPYPPAGPGNQPRTWVSKANNSWYERGYGPKWVVKSGAIHSARTSETLGRVYSVRKTSAGAVVGNKASYAPRVISQAKQMPRFHTIGWTTDKTAVDRVRASGVMKTIISQAIAHALKAKLGGP